MSILTAIPVILFNIAALVAIFYIGRSLFSGFAKTMNIKVDPLASLRNKKIKGYLAQLQLAQAQFEQGNLNKTAQAIKKSFYTDPPLISLKFLDAVHDHNLEVLAFILHINSSSPGLLKLLPDLERLVQSRMALLRSLAETYLSLELVKKRRKTEGKETPDWALSEFSKKIDDLKADLESNDNKITRTIDGICSSIANTNKPEQDISYH